MKATRKIKNEINQYYSREYDNQCEYYIEEYGDNELARDLAFDIARDSTLEYSHYTYPDLNESVDSFLTYID